MSNQYKQQTENAYPNYGAGAQNTYAGYRYQMPTGYQSPYYTQPAVQVPVPQGPFTNAPQVPGMLPMEQSYIENILRLNKGKIATVHQSFETKNGGNEKVFRGVIEAAGRDHIILSDSQSGKRFILLMIYVDFITFDEEIEYNYPFGAR